MEYVPCHGTADIPSPSAWWRKATDYMIKRIEDKSPVLYVPLEGMSGAGRKYFRIRSTEANQRWEDGFHYFVHCKDNDDILWSVVYTTRS